MKYTVFWRRRQLSRHRWTRCRHPFSSRVTPYLRPLLHVLQTCRYRRCCIVVVQAGMRLTITQETRSHSQRTQQLQTNFKLKHKFEITWASLFSADASTRLCVSELQPSSIRLPTCSAYRRAPPTDALRLPTRSFNGNGAPKNSKWRIPVLRLEERYTSGSSWYIGSAWYIGGVNY